MPIAPTKLSPHSTVSPRSPTHATHLTPPTESSDHRYGVAHRGPRGRARAASTRGRIRYCTARATVRRSFTCVGSVAQPQPACSRLHIFRSCGGYRIDEDVGLQTTTRRHSGMEHDRRTFKWAVQVKGDRSVFELPRPLVWPDHFSLRLWRAE